MRACNAKYVLKECNPGMALLMNIETHHKTIENKPRTNQLVFRRAWAYSRRLHERHQVTVLLNGFDMFWAGPGLGRGLLGWFWVVLSFRCF